jgi:hypothetical protein
MAAWPFVAVRSAVLLAVLLADGVCATQRRRHTLFRKKSHTLTPIMERKMFGSLFGQKKTPEEQAEDDNECKAKTTCDDCTQTTNHDNIKCSYCWNPTGAKCTAHPSTRHGGRI